MASISIDFELDMSSMDEVFGAIEESAHQAMRLSVDHVAVQAKRIAPHKTGALSSSIRPDDVSGSFLQGNLEGKVAALAPYAYWVNEGTRAHDIVPRVKKALRFPGARGSGYAFAKRVRHPGTKAQPFLSPSQHSEAVLGIFADAIQLALGK